ncbi:MAG TPA: hypothetical protein VGQ11_03475, partial [Candidatus Acidoferrales bacterium]|nr:hypothetical protein [Candidatus Acidoferrales bacterium]
MWLPRFCPFLAVLAAVLGAGPQNPPRPGEPALFQLPLFPVHIAQKNISLSKALEEIGVRVRNGYVLFGIEVHREDGKEPSVNLDLPPGSTLGDALQQVFRQLPNYSYELVSPHLINIYPAGTKTDPQDPLNIRVQRFEITNKQASDVLAAPHLFIAELQQRLTPPRAGAPQPSGSVGPRMRSTGPPVSLRLRGRTVRQILNAITEATEQFPPQYTPVGWVYSFQRDPA